MKCIIIRMTISSESHLVAKREVDVTVEHGLPPLEVSWRGQLLEALHELLVCRWGNVTGRLAGGQGRVRRGWK